MSKDIPSQLAREAFFNLPLAKREQILNAARAEFITSGYSTASTNAIVKACGIAKGSLFNYFDGKDGLFLYLVYGSAQKLIESIRDCLAKDGGSEGQVRGAYDALVKALEISFEFMAEHPDEYRIAQVFAAPDAQKLVERYIQLFDPEETKLLFQSVVLPADPAQAQTFFWLLSGIKLEIQSLLNASVPPDTIIQTIKTKLAAIQPVLAGPSQGAHHDQG